MPTDDDEIKQNLIDAARASLLLARCDRRPVARAPRMLCDCDACAVAEDLTGALLDAGADLD